MRASRWLRIAISGSLLVVGAACSHHPLPPADGLLRRAAAEMRGVRTLHFDLNLQGPPGPYFIRQAGGVLTRDEATGSVSLDQGGSLIEYQVVIASGGFYLKGPTGGFRQIPAGLAEGAYNPTALLDPDGGVAHILATATRSRTLSAESVGGTDAYRVDARISVDALRELMPLGSKRSNVPASLWIGAGRPVLLQVRILSTAADGEETSTLVLTLTDFNLPVTITPPPT